MPTATLGALELTTLLGVARLKDEAYGLAIRRDLAARTGRDYSVGALYTTLQRLERDGLVESDDADVEGPQKGFRITTEGEEELGRRSHTHR